MTPVLNARGRWIDPATKRFVQPPLTLEQRQHAAMVAMHSEPRSDAMTEDEADGSPFLAWVALAVVVGIAIGIGVVRMVG